MLDPISPLTQLRAALASNTTTPADIAAESIRCANGNASKNTYLYLNESRLTQQAESLAQNFPNPASRPPLFGVPISLKDLFDLAGTVTTCGTRFYAEHNQPATQNSALAARLLATGALIPGKTHLHPLAYGVTGENPYYGDCLQPRNAVLLTGGSSSGAAASVQEGSALAAIGTDTGCSIRVPAALCGLTGYRSSHALAYAPGPWSSQSQPASPEGLWAGGVHLSRSFDTAGFLLRDPRDAAPIANALFGVPIVAAPMNPRIGTVSLACLGDFTPEVLVAYNAWRDQFTRTGATASDFHPDEWKEAPEIYTAILANEASSVHTGHFDEFGPVLGQRLHWGASLTAVDLAAMQVRLAAFRAHIAELFQQFDFLALPCSPVHRLFANQDHTLARKRILRYNTPISLGGLPTVALPGEALGAPLGTGVQLAAAPGHDTTLLAYASMLGQYTVDHPETIINFQS
jgi:aspartyl-tRNA(Asn)/glutamyl-tRNA(Gln) amidotransferase subunit A